MCFGFIRSGWVYVRQSISGESGRSVTDCVVLLARVLSVFCDWCRCCQVLQDKRFKNRELQIMRMLVKKEHPNIVKLKHCFYSNGDKVNDPDMRAVRLSPFHVEHLERAIAKYSHPLTSRLQCTLIFFILNKEGIQLCQVVCRKSSWQYRALICCRIAVLCVMGVET